MRDGRYVALQLHLLLEYLAGRVKLLQLICGSWRQFYQRFLVIGPLLEIEQQWELFGIVALDRFEFERLFIGFYDLLISNLHINLSWIARRICNWNTRLIRNRIDLLVKDRDIDFSF